MNSKDETEHVPPQTNGGEQGDRAALVARRAYDKWQARGCPSGDDRRDWFEAEQEIAAAILASQSKATAQPASRNRVTA